MAEIEDAEVEYGAGEIDPELVEDDAEAYAEPEPHQRVWTIRLEKSVVTASSGYRSWRAVATLHGESMVEWQNDPPIDRVFREHGAGDYRLDVKYGSAKIRMDAYPSVGGARSFHVPDPNDPDGSKARGNHSGNGHNGNGSGGDPLAQAVRAMSIGVEVARGNQPQQQMMPPVPGISVEQAAQILTTKDLAGRNERKLERLEDDTRKAEAAASSAGDAVAALRRDLERRLDDMKGELDRAGKKDPLAEILQTKKLAGALGMEDGGWVGLARDLGTGVLDIAKSGPAGGGGIQLPGEAPKQIEGGGATDWRTADGGVWKNLGEWAEWVGTKILNSQPTSVHLIVMDAASRTVHNDRDAKWFREASVEDIRQLFRMVYGEQPGGLMDQWETMKGEAENFLRLYPVALDQLRAQVQVALADRVAKEAPAAATEQPVAPSEQPPPPPAAPAAAPAKPITVEGRAVTPPPLKPAPEIAHARTRNAAGDGAPDSGADAGQRPLRDGGSSGGDHRAVSGGSVERQP